MYTNTHNTDFAVKEKRQWLRKQRRSALITDALQVSVLGISIALILAAQI